MRAIGIDWGERHVGVAISDSNETLATPYSTIDHAEDEKFVFEKIKQIIEDVAGEVIVLGLPRSLDGSDGVAASAMRERCDRLEEFSQLPVELIDERLTSVTAHSSLKSAGMSAKKRKNKVDEVAASILLQSWLDSRAS